MALVNLIKKLGTYTMDLVLLGLNILLWLNMESILLRLDPTSAVPSGEYLAKFLFAFFGLCCAHTSIKLIMWLTWPNLDKHLEAKFKNHFDTLNPWQRVKISLCIFCFYCTLYVLLVAAM